MSLPSDQFKEIRNIITSIANLMGADMAQPKLFHPKQLGAVMIFLPIYFTMQITGIYRAWPNITIIAHSLIGLPFLLQEIGRAYNRFVKNDEEVTLKIRSKIDEFYKNHESNLNYRRVLNEKMIIFRTVIKVYIVCHFIYYYLPILSIIINAIVTQQLNLVIPVSLPYLDSHNLLGFLINTTVFGIINLYIAISMGIIEFHSIVFGYQAIPMIEILCMKIDEFEKLLQERKVKESSKKVIESVHGAHSKTTTVNVSKSKKVTFSKNIAVKNENQQSKVAVKNVEENLIEIIKGYTCLNEFLELIFEVFELPTFIMLSSNSYALCIATLAFLTYSKIIGVSLLILFSFQVLLPCIIGTLIETQQQKFLEKLCGFPWYELSKSKQKIFLQFIHMCQNGAEFELPMIGNANMELFQSVFNAAYSFFMYIWNFVDA